jgi:hypothetical protein
MANPVQTTEMIPLTSAEIRAFGNRCLVKSHTNQGMLGTVLLRCCIDLDHLARMVDEKGGSLNYSFWVQVKEKPKAKRKAATKLARK